MLGLIGGSRAALLFPGLYLAALLVGSLAVGIHRRAPAAILRRAPAAILLPLILMTMHLSWGVGFFAPPRITPAADRAPEPVGNAGSGI